MKKRTLTERLAGHSTAGVVKERTKKKGQTRIAEDPLARIFRWALYHLLPEKKAVGLLVAFHIRP